MNVELSDGEMEWIDKEISRLAARIECQRELINELAKEKRQLEQALSYLSSHQRYVQDVDNVLREVLEGCRCGAMQEARVVLEERNHHDWEQPVWERLWLAWREKWR